MAAWMDGWIPLLLMLSLIGSTKAMVVVPAFIHGKHVRRMKRQR